MAEGGATANLLPSPRPSMSARLNIALLGHASTHEDFTYAFGLYRIQAYCLAAGLDQHNYRVFDRKSSDDEAQDLELLLAEAPDIVGLSAYLWNLPRVVRLVSALRQRRPELLIVIGGPSAKGFDDLAIDDTRPDLLVVGFGELAFANIVRAVAAGELEQRIDQLGNVVHYPGKTGPGVQRSAPLEAQASLDDLPSPYLMGLVELATKTLYVETDRGCPYSCAFCIESTASPKVTAFSMARVEAELRWALERKMEHIEMCSAIFNRDTEWLAAFVELVERLDPGGTLTFSGALYSTYVDERQADLLSRLNLKSALFGLNSTNPETFKSVRRVIRLEQFAKQIGLLGGFLRPEVSLIMGLPGDTPEGFAKTLDFASSLEADVMIFRFMVLPNTLYYEQRDRYELEIDFEHDNRILSTSSYSREDFAQMEAIAAAAGFEQLSPGQWAKRRNEAVQAPEMARKLWNFAYLALRALDLASMAWPDGWRFDRVVLELRRYVQIKLLGPGDQQLEIFVFQRVDDVPHFAQSRFFNVAYRERGQRDEGSGARPVLERFVAALVGAERELLGSRRR